jgi:hypothetical protein
MEDDNIKIDIEYVRMGAEWNWLRIVSIVRDWYYCG